MFYIFFSVSVIFLVMIAIVSLPPLRRFVFVKPMLVYLKKALPAISRTEEIVLEAGDMWWEKDLFRGNPAWKALHTISLSTLMPDEQAFIDNHVETLCSLLDDYKILTEYHDLPSVVWDYLKQNKFFGLVIPRKYGGLGFSAIAHSTIVLKIATRSVSAAVTALVPNSLGPAELLLHYGTEEQKDYYLPRLAIGKEIPCFALTSLQAGSDASAMIDNGILCKGQYQNKEIIGIRLNFNKRYITLAPIATVIGVAFKLFDPENLMGKNAEIGITVALVPSKFPGVETGQRHSPMGLAFLNGPVVGKDVFIPIDFVVGGEKRLGQGWRMLMECLSIGRGISLPAVSAAQAQLAYRMTGAYSVLREQFKQPLFKFEGVAAALAKIAGLTYLMEAVRRFTVTAVDASLKPALASSIAKYHMTEMARIIVNHAMDIHGGRGIQLGPRNYLAQGYIAIPISITVEGANILTRNLILFGQGAVRCHPFLLKEIKAIQKKDSKALDSLLLRHIFYSLKNGFKTFFFALGLSNFFVKSPIKNLKNYYGQLSRMSAALALLSDFTLLMLGGSIKSRERLSARLGDVLSYLYMASSVLRYYQDYESSKEDLNYTEWCLDYCLYHIQLAFERFFANFPYPFLARGLKFVIFPLGRSYQLPSDKEESRLVYSMVEKSRFRDRMSLYCYLGKVTGDATGNMELAFNQWVSSKPIREKLKKLMRGEKLDQHLTLEQQLHYALRNKLLTPSEVEKFLSALTSREELMKVDQF